VQVEHGLTSLIDPTRLLLKKALDVLGVLLPSQFDRARGQWRIVRRDEF
jgi:hypothetical protein